MIVSHMVPPDNPATWSWDEARAVLALDKAATENLAFYDGDHWQRGVAWTGPKLDPTAGQISDDTLDLVRAGFTSANVVKEIVHRHRDAVLGHPVMWHGGPRRFLPEGEKPTAAEQATVIAIEAALTAWADRVRVQEPFLKATAQMLLTGHGVIRAFVPASALDIVTFAGEDSLRPLQVRGVVAATLEEALSKIAIEAPSVQQAVLYEHPRTRQRIGVLRQSVNAVEIIDLCYVLPNGLTELRQLSTDPVGPPVQLDLGGRLPLMQGALIDGALITEQVRQNQRAMNLALSMVPRTAVTAGFLERLFFDAMPPGEWEYDESGNRTKFVPSTNYRLGAGSTSFIQGTEYNDPQGQMIVKDPSVTFREPIDPKGVFNAAMYHYAVMLAEVRQEHVLTNTEALMSGKSREQARAGFEASVRPTKTQCEFLAASVYETVLAMAEAFIRQPGQYTDTFRILTTCRVDTGPSAASEREQDNVSVEKGLMAIQTGMERAGIVDVDAEMARIAASPTYQLALLEKQFLALKAAADAGIPVEAAAELMGLDTKLIAAIKRARADAEAEASGPPQPGAAPRKVA